MPEFEHCRQHCCLLSIDMHAPKYRLGQILASTYTDDETGETFSYRVQVVGFTQAIPGWLRVGGWWYFCKFLPGSSQSWLVESQSVESFHESDLREVV